MKNLVLIIATAFLATGIMGQHGNPGPFQFSSSPDKVDIPIIIKDRDILVESEVNGKKGLFYWDTGAPTIIVNTEAFNSKGDSKDAYGAKKVSGATGDISNVTKFQIEEFSLAEFKSDNISTMGMPLGHLKDGELGLLGTRMMKGYFTEFDLKSQKIRMTRLNEGEKINEELLKGYDKLETTWGAHLPIVVVEINGQKLNMVFDSGCSTMMIHPKHKELLSGSYSFAENDTLKGGGKNEIIFEALNFKELMCGNRTFNNVRGMFEVGIDPDFGPGNIDGIIGWDIFFHSVIAYDINNQAIYIREN